MRKNYKSLWNKYPNTKYYSAKNLRKITNDALSTGAMCNFPEPSVIIQDSTDDGDDAGIRGTILGTVLVRDVLVVFFVDISGNSIIYKTLSTDSNFTLVYTDASSTSKLGFNLSKPIRAVGRYESEDVQKVYWK